MHRMEIYIKQHGLWIVVTYTSSLTATRPRALNPQGLFCVACVQLSKSWVRPFSWWGPKVKNSEARSSRNEVSTPVPESLVSFYEPGCMSGFRV